MLPRGALACLAAGLATTAEAATMDCTQYYTGAITGSLTSYVDEVDSHTLITNQCACPRARRTPAASRLS